MRMARSDDRLWETLGGGGWGGWVGWGGGVGELGLGEGRWRVGAVGVGCGGGQGGVSGWWSLCVWGGVRVCEGGKEGAGVREVGGGIFLYPQSPVGRWPVLDAQTSRVAPLPSRLRPI